MFVLGVYRLDQLDARLLHTRRGRRKLVAATLYPQISDSEHPDQDRWRELVLCQFANSNHTYKRTYAHRFGDFNQQIARFVTEIDRRGALRVHDVAVSDGITAVEFYRALADATQDQLDFVASDISNSIVAVQDKRLTLVLDAADHSCLQLIYPPFVFNLCKPENLWRFPINWLVRCWLEHRRCTDLKQRYLAGDSSLQVQRIDLLHPSCRQMIDGTEHFHFHFRFRQVDIMQPIEGRYELIRAMNILNPSYFETPELQRALTHFHACLTPGGLLATGSNQESHSLVDGGIYRKTRDGFERLCQSGSGSSIDELIRSLTACSNA